MEIVFGRGIGNLRYRILGLKDGRTGAHGDLRGAPLAAGGHRDGTGRVDTLYANTRNNPIEDHRDHLPLRVRATSCAEDGAGAGRWARRPGWARCGEFAS